MNEYQNPAGASADQTSTDRSVKGELEAGKGKLAQIADTAAAAGKAKLDSGLTEVAGQADTLARALGETADRLKSEHQDSLAAYTTHIASTVTSLADRLRSSSVDELASDARRLAHSNPTLFLAGSVALGFGLTRFLKASSGGASAMGRTDRYGSAYGDSRGDTDTFRQDRTGQSWQDRDSGTSGDRDRVFPEMGSAGLSPDGSYGGSRTNQLSGGVNG
jgi:hypothetical protein